MKDMYNLPVVPPRHGDEEWLKLPDDIGEVGAQPRLLGSEDSEQFEYVSFKPQLELVEFPDI